MVCLFVLQMGKQPSKPISETELTHLVNIEHTLDAKQRALEPQATPVAVPHAHSHASFHMRPRAHARTSRFTLKELREELAPDQAVACVRHR